MSKLVFGVSRVITERERALAGNQNMLLYRFIEAYNAMVTQCPKGDIILNLRVEVDKPEDAGVDPTKWEAPRE